jgi:hypothetical protein
MNMGACVNTEFASAPWVAALLHFNLRPALYAHPSWLPNWAHKLETLTPRVREALSVELLREHRLDIAHDWGMHDRAGRLFMIEPDLRDRLALAIGIAVHRDSLRQVVLKPRLNALRAVLGEALDTLWLPVAEAVERSPVSISITWESFNGVSLRKTLVTDGYRQMLRLVDPNQRAVWGRAVLCVPRDLASQKRPALGAAPAARLLDGIMMDIIPRGASSWTWLF